MLMKSTNFGVAVLMENLDLFIETLNKIDLKNKFFSSLAQVGKSGFTGGFLRTCLNLISKLRNSSNFKLQLSSCRDKLIDAML